VEPLDSDERFAGLVRHSVLRPYPTDAIAYLELATLPTWRFVRPRELNDMDRANAQLLEVLG
jgi:hypothetical protein